MVLLWLSSAVVTGTICTFWESLPSFMRSSQLGSHELMHACMHGIWGNCSSCSCSSLCGQRLTNGGPQASFKCLSLPYVQLVGSKSPTSTKSFHVDFALQPLPCRWSLSRRRGALNGCPATRTPIASLCQQTYARLELTIAFLQSTSEQRGWGALGEPA